MTEAPLYHEQEYPLNLVIKFGHRIDFWEDQTLLIAERIRESNMTIEYKCKMV